MKMLESIENNNIFLKIISKNSNVKIYKCDNFDFITDEKNSNYYSNDSIEKNLFNDS